ncbi:MAG: SDR family NAD(P)-dependent oxidoreductase [Candidatus Rokubacteria bacterium]|nr:SDR family NAD(P)-dependent oxidoreductase [Candidatus Rokubacteria bacterium]
MKSHFASKTAFVTGGASGIGRALAELLVDAGANVVLADVDRDGAATLAAAIGRAGGTVRPVHLDVRPNRARIGERGA